MCEVVHTPSGLIWRQSRILSGSGSGIGLVEQRQEFEDALLDQLRTP
jgi:hypothetical protein